MDLIAISLAARKALEKLGVKKGQLIATVELEEDEGCTFVEYNGKLNLVVGQTYEVKTDSGTYQAVCKEVDEGEGAYFRYLGNGDIFDDVSAPGDHYCIGEGFLGDYYVSAIDSRFGKSISVSTPATPIDPKFLPDECMSKVLDLTKIIYTQGDLAGTSVSDALSLLFQASLQNSGSLETIDGVPVSHDNIRKIATTNRDTYIIKLAALGSDFKVPATYVYSSAGAAQLAFSSMLTVPGVGVVNMQVYLQFHVTGNNILNAGVKATVL